MSGAGKSYWSQQLGSAGFEVIDCDLVIARRLESELNRTFEDLDVLDSWMGLPDEHGYEEREALYLERETALMQGIAEDLAAGKYSTRRLVIDTTGGIVYVGEGLLAQLRNLVTFTYLAINPSVHEAMLQRYLERPVPVLWRGHFQQRPGEDRQEAFRRSYSAMLSNREVLYQAIADVTLPYEVHHAPGLTPQGFLEEVRSRL